MNMKEKEILNILQVPSFKPNIQSIKKPLENLKSFSEIGITMEETMAVLRTLSNASTSVKEFTDAINQVANLSRAKGSTKGKIPWPENEKLY